MGNIVAMGRRWAVALITTFVLLGAGGASAAVPFSDLITTEGERVAAPVTVGDGQWTLVMIWATNCHICKAQKPVLSAFHDEHKQTDARVFGVALDGRSGLDAVNDYLEKHPATFPNYVGEFSIVSINYQQLTEEALRGTPTYLLFDREGNLRGNNPGPITVAALESFIARHDSTDSATPVKGTAAD